MSADYEPHFDLLGTHRRVLGFITDEEHQGRPRNTAEVLAEDLNDDPNTRFDIATDDVQEFLDDLEAEGFVSKKKDGAYSVTDAGRVELTS
jgi:hypothetical protein